jgi:trehalose/maltose hydrolase-like predicted phosphorylase
MNNSVAVKQADVVLLTYPLDYGEDYSAGDKLLDLDYVSLPRTLVRSELMRSSMPTSSLLTGLL